MFTEFCIERVITGIQKSYFWYYLEDRYTDREVINKLTKEELADNYTQFCSWLRNN